MHGAVPSKGPRTRFHSCQFPPQSDRSDPEEMTLNSVEVEASSHVPLVFFPSAQQRLSVYLICLSTGTSCLSCRIPGWLRFPAPARESRQPGLNYRASHQFVSTGEPAANWKTCTLATLHNEQCRKTLKRKCQVCPVVSADIKGSSTILKQSKLYS